MLLLTYSIEAIKCRPDLKLIVTSATLDTVVLSIFTISRTVQVLFHDPPEETCHFTSKSDAGCAPCLELSDQLTRLCPFCPWCHKVLYCGQLSTQEEIDTACKILFERMIGKPSDQRFWILLYYPSILCLRKSSHESLSQVLERLSSRLLTSQKQVWQFLAYTMLLILALQSKTRMTQGRESCQGDPTVLQGGRCKQDQ